jgi:hypothetical protein
MLWFAGFRFEKHPFGCRNAVADLSTHNQEEIMKTILSIIGATTLLASAASAAPLSPAAVGIAEASSIDQVRLVCNEDGRCFRTRGPRYVQRYVDDGYYPRRSYNYYGGPGYYSGPAYGGYYGGGPSIGFSFGTGRW